MAATMSIVGPGVFAHYLSKKDSVSGKVKVKKRATKNGTNLSHLSFEICFAYEPRCCERCEYTA